MLGLKTEDLILLCLKFASWQIAVIGRGGGGGGGISGGCWSRVQGGRRKHPASRKLQLWGGQGARPQHPLSSLLSGPKTDKGSRSTGGTACGGKVSGLARAALLLGGPHRGRREPRSSPRTAGGQARPRWSRALGTCRGRSRPRLPGQRRGRPGRPPSSSRGLPASGARRPPARAPRRLAGGKVWPRPQGPNFPARPPRQLSARSPSADPGRRPSARLDYLLWLFPQRLSLRGGHLELPDSWAAVAVAARTVEATGGGGRGSRAVAHVPTASGTVELRIARRIRI